MVCNGQFVYAIRRRTTTGQSVLGYAHPYPIHVKYIRRIFLYITRKYIVYMDSRIVFNKKRKRIALIFHSKPISNRLDDKKKKKKKKKSKI